VSTLEHEEPAGEVLEEHFVDLVQQDHAWRLGMWVFLASEILLFSALFTLYSYYRLAYPQDFAEGIRGNNRLLGSLNTVVLITSSLCAALGVHAVEKRHLKSAAVGIGLTILLALGFLVIKGTEYGQHFAEGAYPGGVGRHIAEHGVGAAAFYNMYFLLTGAHAIHVIIGGSVLVALSIRLWRGTLKRPATAFEVGVLYWHLVDIIWIFLWPLFYLTGGHA
jgi:cytochrome c oxidase subunit 3